jgi:outer membrane protein OmpA-like peptidoglycan-associated protein
MKRNTWLVALFCAAVSAQSGAIHALATAGSMDDVPGSFARGATLAAKCPKPPGISASAPQPMHVEMVLVDTWRRPSGDVEAITHVIPADDGVRATNTTRGFSSDADTEGRPSAASRTLCAADLADSSTYNTGFGDGYPEIFPGTTEFSLSTATMRLLRTTGEAPLDYIQYEFQSSSGFWVPFQFSGTLRRVEPSDVRYPLIVDGEPVTLAALHAKGVFEFSGPESLREQVLPEKIKQTAEFYLLDDESKPISLLFKFGPQFQIQVVSISYPTRPQAKALEQQLLTAKHAVVYGIYFDFNSDRLRPESQPVLQEIAEAMLHNPDWKLTIDGHTDNIGADAKNLDLSRRRAESVRRALVEQYHLSGVLMSTTGYGASRPVDSNDTLAGRARNRRVELTRQ